MICNGKPLICFAVSDISLKNTTFYDIINLKDGDFMLKKILITISSVLAVSVLCFIIIFAISVNQAKNIVRLIDEQDYESLESACESALFIDKIPTVSLIANALCEINVWTPLQTACNNNDIEAVRILLENGADPNKTPPFQLPWYAPIQIAASSGNVDIMTILIEHGADVELHGHNALIKLTKDARYAKNGISIETYKAAYSLLEQHGMSASHPSFEERPLLCDSALLSDIEVTKFLIEDQGISANICGSDGRTPLHYACLSGFTDPTKEYIQYLLDHGVDHTIKDTYGKTAYDYAVEHGLTEITELLICTP